MKTPASKRQRFSLLEILVTIGIMAIVASLLLPTAARSRNKGKQMQCLSQCRQLGMGLNLYSDENEGYLPVEEWVSGSGNIPATYWTHKAKKYFGDPRPVTEKIPFLICPSMPAGDDFEVDDNRKSNFMTNDIIFRYGGGAVVAPPPYESIKIDAIVTPTKTNLVMCGSSVASTNPALTANEKALLSRSGVYEQVIDSTLRFPHVEELDNANVVYADSHTTQIRIEDVPASPANVFWDPTQ